MSLIDLTLAGVMALLILKSVQASLNHRQLGLTKNIVAFIVALLLHQHAAYLLGTTSLPARMGSFVDGVISLPAGPGTEVARGLLWLREADLPEAVTQAIREAWLSDISADVQVMTLAARRVVAKAVLNLACFVVLFMVVRWLLNLTSIHVVKALPPSIARASAEHCGLCYTGSHSRATRCDRLASTLVG
ncbi:MAG: hypothetical protein DDT20_01440 [Firmicutes bacterium]|nr:hypothetical protein [Bacillota bacterium]